MQVTFSVALTCTLRKPTCLMHHAQYSALQAVCNMYSSLHLVLQHNYNADQGSSPCRAPYDYNYRPVHSAAPRPTSLGSVLTYGSPLVTQYYHSEVSEKRRSPGKHEKQDGYSQVRRGHVDPHVDGERVQEGEQTGLLLHGLAVQNADTCVRQMPVHTTFHRAVLVQGLCRNICR